MAFLEPELKTILFLVTTCPKEIANWSKNGESRVKIKAEKDRSEAARKAWKTRRTLSAFAKAKASEAASKEALSQYCKANGWRVAFFEGSTGAPRTGIIDAIAFRLNKRNADGLEVRLIQLKGGSAGVSGREIARLKKAVEMAIFSWGLAAYDGEALHLVPDWKESK